MAAGRGLGSREETLETGRTLAAGKGLGSREDPGSSSRTTLAAGRGLGSLATFLQASFLGQPLQVVSTGVVSCDALAQLIRSLILSLINLLQVSLVGQLHQVMASGVVSGSILE